MQNVKGNMLKGILYTIIYNWEKLKVVCPKNKGIVK